jgi:WhiB family redox-sensing transcriptional regulator
MTKFMERGLCKGKPTDWWFPMLPPGMGRDVVRRVREESRKAKELCSVCPVRLECLQYAIDNKEEYGIWGGLDEKERGWTRRGRRSKLQITVAR